MGIRLSKMFQRNSPPTHDDVAAFLASFLPPSPRPRDVDYFYHVPPPYMRPKPAAPSSSNLSTTALSSSTDTASTLALSTPTALDNDHEERRRNNTPVSHITLSITPTPGVYTSLFASSQSFLPRSAAPIAFIHRPWSLERWKVPRGTTVLSSHTGFDETLTVGWNVKLAGRLGVDVGEARETAGQDEGGLMDGVMGREEGRRCVCLKGYKGDEERRIGLVGGFGRVEGSKRQAMVGVQAGEMREERGDEDVDGGVRLDAADVFEEVKVAKEEAVSVSLKELLVRIDNEFAGIGEVFEFSSSPKSENLAGNADSLQSAQHTTAPMVSNDPALLLSTETTDQPELSRKPPKRQKKTPAPPPPPLPPSIPLAKSYTNTPTPDQPITAIAIMNAFHPEEVERAVSAAYAGGWIDWQPVGLSNESKDPDQVAQMAAQEAASSTESIVEGINVSRTTDSAPALPTSSATMRVQNDLPKDCFQGSILMLTGAARAPGIAHVQSHYGDKVVVVCVGHAACEEWGVKFLAEECRRKWPGVDVREVFEEEVVVPRERKEKKQVAPEEKEVL